MNQIDLPRRHHLDAITSERWTASDQNRWTPSVRYDRTASLESAVVCLEGADAASDDRGDDRALAARPQAAEAVAALRGDPPTCCRTARHHDRGIAGAAVGDAPGRSERRADLAHIEAAWPDAQKKSLPAAEQDRPDVAEARAEWRKSQPTLDPGRLIFVDEPWTKTNMVRLY